MSCMSQNFRLFLVSNLSVLNFLFFLLMYPGSAAPPPVAVLPPPPSTEPTHRTGGRNIKCCRPRPTAHRPGRYSSGRRTRCNIGEDRAVSVGSGGGYRSARRPRKSAGCYIGVRLGKGQLNWAIQSLAETQTVGSGVGLGEEAG